MPVTSGQILKEGRVEKEREVGITNKSKKKTKTGEINQRLKPVAAYQNQKCERERRHTIVKNQVRLLEKGNK